MVHLLSYGKWSDRYFETDYLAYMWPDNSLDETAIFLFELLGYEWQIHGHDYFLYIDDTILRNYPPTLSLT